MRMRGIGYFALVVVIGVGVACEGKGRTMRERTSLAPQHMAVESIDLAIQTTVLESLASDPYIALQLKNVKVTVKNRVVILDGELETEEQKKKAEALARGVEKVRDVINHLKVSGKQEVTGLLE